MHIINLSEFDPGWNWLESRFAARPDLGWTHVTVQTPRVPAWVPRRRSFERASAAWVASKTSASGPSMLVSHGPRMTMYGAFASRARRERCPHLAYSFNFTSLPSGLERQAMSTAFGAVDKFVVFSTMERRLYSEFFEIEAERIDMIHWAVRPPSDAEADAPPLVAGDYICAIGSQGRDYRVLFDAMRRLPGIRLLLVATADSVAGLEPPSNVELRIRIPLAQAHNILANSRFMVLPLSGSDVPCGHVTLVAAMHRGKAMVATRSEGIADYLEEGVNGRMVAPKDAGELARVIGDLYAAPDDSRRLGAQGRAFARAHCVEDNVVDYFAQVIGNFPS